MAPRFHIQPVTERTLEICAEVIAESFTPIAQQFGITRENCPTNAAFIAPRHVKADYEAGDAQFLLYENAFPVGFVQVAPKEEGAYTLKHLGVRPAYAHQGYGTRLIRKAEEYVAERGGGTLEIGIIEQNTVLKHWYQRLGYLHTDVRDVGLPFLVGYMQKAVPAYEEAMSLVQPDDPIFSSTAYRSDVIAFNLIEMLRMAPCLLASNGRSAVVAQSSPEYPAWVWTSDDLTFPEREALVFFLRLTFEERGGVRLVARPELLDVLAADGDLEAGKRITMVAYSCPKVVLQESGADIRTAQVGDEDTLAAFSAEFQRECFGTELSEEDCRSYANAAIQNQSHFLLFVNGQPTAGAAISSVDNGLARISHVYTVPSERRKGCAATLVAALCRRLLAEDKLPVLFADASNPASNRAYQNVGFKAAGVVADQTFTGKK